MTIAPSRGALTRSFKFQALLTSASEFWMHYGRLLPRPALGRKSHFRFL